MLYPMFALVCFTFVFGLINFIWRFKSVKSGSVRARYYKLMQGGDIPDHIVAGTRHFSNLFEMPVLFYVVGVLALILNVETTLMLTLAWSYVVLRIVHAYIHVTYNHILHRLSVFWIAALILLAMWIHLVIAAS